MERDCLFFNISTKEFHEESCDEGPALCTIFAIEGKRLKFNLKSICDDLWQIDEIYFLQSDTYTRGFLTFHGIGGLTNIQWTKDEDEDEEEEDSHWTIDPLTPGDETEHTAILNASSDYPIGLKTWESKLTCSSDDIPQSATYSKQLFNFNNVSYTLLK